MTATTSPLSLTSGPETTVGAARWTWSRRTSLRLAVATQVLVLAASNFPTPLFVYVAALIPAMLTLGRITDRVGRRPALVAGMAITTISSLAFAAADIRVRSALVATRTCRRVSPSGRTAGGAEPVRGG